LTGKSFSDFDNSNEDDVIALLYCIQLPKETFEIYKRTAKVAQKALVNEIKKISDEMVIINQFSTVKLEESDTVTESDTKNHEMVSNIATALIYGGLNAHFVMEELEIADLPIFIKGLEDKRKEELENSRLWTFFNVLPHVGKGFEKPQDLIRFAWEKETEKKEADKNIKDNTDILSAFFKGKVK